MLESEFQAQLIKELEDIFPNCMILKNDANYIQGFPDLLILYEDRWAALECKKNAKASFRPNQEYYIELLNDMSYASAIWPEIKEEVFYELQQALRPRRSTRVSKRV